MMHKENRETALLSALDWLIFIMAFAMLVLLTAGYFVLPKLIHEQSEWLSFLQAIITNLIPVLLLFVLSYIAYRRIEVIRSERDTDLLVQKVVNNVVERLQAVSQMNSVQKQNSNEGVVQNRSDIAEINKQLISEADDIVVSFSGDLSWIENSHTELLKAVNRNVKVQLLCKDPITSEAKKLVEKYYQQPGIQIRYYPSDFVLGVRGMMIDIPIPKKAVFFKKQHKILGENFTRGSGKPGDTATFDYWLRVCDGEDDLAIVAPFAQLFNVLWERASNADILERRESDFQIVQRELKKLYQYTQAEIELRRIKVANLRPLHRYIDEAEYKRIDLLAKRFRWHHFEYWELVSVLFGDRRKLICPPIIEVHNDTWSIVDGLARVHYSREQGQSEIIACVVEKVSEPPVGEIRNWEEVRIVKDSDYKKNENFRRLDMSRWRHLDTLHKGLTLSV